MGGAGYIFSGDHDAHVIHNSDMINFRMADCVVQMGAISPMAEMIMEIAGKKLQMRAIVGPRLFCLACFI